MVALRLTATWDFELDDETEGFDKVAGQQSAGA
jgi:hypothetical protein